MSNLQTSPVGVKGQISYFFRQTFRRHSGAEYSELFTRGMRGMKGVNRKYPWAYIRLFGLLFILFAVYVLIVRFTSNQLFEPMITTVAGFMFNLSFLVLIYELYPEKDLTLMSVLLALLLGGAGSHTVTQILFNVLPTSNEWLQAVSTGFFEELPKAAATIFVIIGCKRHSPLAGFVLGAAVGCGFSIVEDMGYMFTMANEMPVVNLTTVITVAIERGLTAFCTHILWTAAVGWVYNLHNKWLASLAFWLVLLLSCGLHILWDLPLSYVGKGFVCAACVVIAAIECILILNKERKAVFVRAKQLAAQKAEPAENEVKPDISSGEQLTLAIEGDPLQSVAVEPPKEEHSPKDNVYYYEEDSLTMNSSYYKYWRHWGHLCLMLGAFLMAVVGVIYSAIPSNERYSSQTFENGQELVDYMQDGYTFYGADMQAKDFSQKREFDKNAPHSVSGEYYTQRESGKAINKEGEVHEVTFEYLYSGFEDDVHQVYFSYVTRLIWSETETRELETLNHNGKQYATFFRLTGDSISGYNFIERKGSDEVKIMLFTYHPDFVRNLTDWEYASFFIALGVIAGSTGICYVSFKIKSWRIKKLCSTTTASSAK